MMQTRVVNIKTVDFDENNPDHVYIGRANKNYGLAKSKWANPFIVGEDGTREQVIQAFREWIKHQPELMNALEELRGKILVCYCCPKACHGHVLVELLEGNNDLKIHPAAELFPPMTEAEFLGLKEDIREHGQREAIVVWQGQLIDGRHRLRACRELGIEPEIAELMDETDPWQYVVSHNLHRRHLTTAQRAMVADKLASLKQGEKKADTGIPVSPPSQAEAAAMLNVSVDSVQQARKIRKAATPETVAAVERGEITLNAAVATVKPAVATEKPVVSKPTKADVIAVEQQLTAMANYCTSADRIVDWFSQQSPRKKMAFIKKCHADADVIKLRSGNQNSLMQIANDALYRLTFQERGELICNQLLHMTPEEREMVYASVDHMMKKKRSQLGS